MAEIPEDCRPQLPNWLTFRGYQVFKPSQHPGQHSMYYSYTRQYKKLTYAAVRDIKEIGPDQICDAGYLRSVYGQLYFLNGSSVEKALGPKFEPYLDSDGHVRARLKQTAPTPGIPPSGENQWL